MGFMQGTIRPAPRRAQSRGGAEMFLLQITAILLRKGIDSSALRCWVFDQHGAFEKVAQGEQQLIAFTLITRCRWIPEQLRRIKLGDPLRHQNIESLEQARNAVNLLNAISLLPHVPVQVRKMLIVERRRDTQRSRVDAFWSQADIEHIRVAAKR